MEYLNLEQSPVQPVQTEVRKISSKILKIENMSLKQAHKELVNKIQKCFRSISIHHEEDEIESFMIYIHKYITNLIEELFADPVYADLKTAAINDFNSDCYIIFDTFKKMKVELQNKQ